MLPPANAKQRPVKSAYLDELRWHIKNCTVAIAGQAHALDLLHLLLWQMALQSAEHEARALYLNAIVKQQGREALMSCQQ